MKPSRYRVKKAGLMMVDVFLGIAIMVFVLAAAVSFLYMTSERRLLMLNDAKAASKLRNVAEAIRYQAAGNFESLTETNFDRTGDFDKQILVWSTISPVDPTTRTRNVTLLAKWKQGQGPWSDQTGGNVKSSTFTFVITNIRAKLRGAVVKVRVVKKGTTTGVEGVRLRAQGQDVPEILAETGSDGYGYLYGVIIRSNGNVPIHFDAELVSCYFENPDSFTRDVNVTNTQAGQIKEVPAQEVIPPGTMAGAVFDAVNTSLPVASADVYAYSKPGTVAIESSSRPHAVTDNTGHYTFGALLPGQYAVFFKGNTVYAALDKVNSSDPANRTHFIVTSGNTTSTPTLYAVKTGTLYGHLLRATWNGAGFVAGTAIGDAVNVAYFRSPAFVGRDNPSPSVTFDFTKSISYLDYWQSNMGTQNSGTAAANDGSFTFTNDIPRIILDDTVNPKTYQYVKASYRIAKNPKSPLTPVLVLLGNATSAKFLVRSTTSAEIVVPQHGLNTASFDDFIIKVFPNEGVPQNELTMYAMNESALSNVKGKVIFNPNVPTATFTGANAVHYVRTLWGSQGATSNVVGTGGVRRGTKNDIAQYYTRTTFNLNAGDHDYDMKDDANLWTLIPTLGADTMQLEFIGYTSLIVDSKQFKINVVGYKKILQGTDIKFAEESPLNISDLVVEFWYALPNGNVLQHPNNLTMNVSNGVYGGNPLHDVYHRDEYAGRTGEFTLAPNQELTSAINPNVDITINASTLNRMTYYLRAQPTADWVNPWSSYGNGRGHPFGFDTPQNAYVSADASSPYIYLYKRAKATIKGIVTDTSGNPILGATLVLHRSYYTDESGTCPSNSNEFTFTDREFVMDPGQNLYLKVSSAGPDYYPTDYKHTEAYDGMTWTVTFRLSKVNSGGGGGPGGSG